MKNVPISDACRACPQMLRVRIYHVQILRNLKQLLLLLV